MLLNPVCKILLLSAGFVLLPSCKPAVDEAKTPVSTSSATELPANETAIKPVKANDATVASFDGFGPAKFGGDEESVRMSWGRPLNAGKPAEGASCYYLSPEAAPDAKRSIGFMFEDGKFVRYDVADASLSAPGNIRVGDSADAVKAAFPDRIGREAPHKYIEKGFTLTVTPEAKSTAFLVFEFGEERKVLNWRIGMMPQIFYVEGCS